MSLLYHRKVRAAWLEPEHPTVLVRLAQELPPDWFESAVVGDDAPCTRTLRGHSRLGNRADPPTLCRKMAGTNPDRDAAGGYARRRLGAPSDR